MPAVLNAANEIAVHSFLAGHLRFAEIPDVVAYVMSATRSKWSGQWMMYYNVTRMPGIDQGTNCQRRINKCPY